ncbi:uncharacterized protein TNCV_4651291 [Trichonephila clavipes]|nr:uncharacterized protein TNCV_4651291 [Trichonephila clavipes]
MCSVPLTSRRQATSRTQSDRSPHKSPKTKSVQPPVSLTKDNKPQLRDCDECTFEILQNKAQFVRCRHGEKFHSDCVVQTVKHPTKTMIWSVISGKGNGRLYVVKSVMREDHDEAHFWLNGYVNKQSCRIWSEANPQVYVKTPLHPEKLTVWCALWAGGILLQKR